MRSFLRLLTAGLVFAGTAATASAQITATFYRTGLTSNINQVPPSPTWGSPLTNVFCTVQISRIYFHASDFQNLWSTAGCTGAPSTATSFGARFTGTLDVATGGNKQLRYYSDDGAMFFLNGTQRRNDWGPQTASWESFTTNFNAGSNAFQFDFYANNLTPSAFKVELRDGVTYGVVPEPSTYALMATGLVALAGVARRRRSA